MLSPVAPALRWKLLFSGELEAFRGCDIKAQPVDQQDPGARSSGPPGTLLLPEASDCGLFWWDDLGQRRVEQGPSSAGGEGYDKLHLVSSREEVSAPPSHGEEGPGDPSPSWCAEPPSPP